MNISDFRCNSCGKVFEYDKVSGNDNFPENPECVFCKSTDTTRIWKNHISIPQSFKAV
jgi:hypothetical protein